MYVVNGRNLRGFFFVFAHRIKQKLGTREKNHLHGIRFYRNILRTVNFIFPVYPLSTQ